MRRREFIALLCGAAVAWPLAARAQNAMPVIGFLGVGSPGPFAPHVAAFRQGLSEAGYVEGQNVAIEYRWAEGRDNLLPALAAEFVRRNVAVIATSGGPAPALAAQAATAIIPIVFSSADPVERGLVASLARPSGNITGINNMTFELTPKRFELMSELVPQAGVIALLVNPSSPSAEPLIRDMQEAARSKGVQLHILKVSTDGEIETAFAALVQLRAGALIIAPDAFFNSQREAIVALAARHVIPVIYQGREFVAAGGLMSYGTSLPDMYRLVGVYVGRILAGAKPADLPVQQPTKFELVINLKTAKALGLTVPQSLLAHADEVIE